MQPYRIFAGQAFKTNIERYPNSANVYDSLGEAYEKSGRHSLARENYQKAVEIGAKTNDPNLVVFKTNSKRMEAMAKKGDNK
jgi:Tfp pilus assembly protein PilF